MNLFNQIAEDSENETTPLPSTETLSQLDDLLRRRRILEREILSLETSAKERAEELTVLEERDIPNLLRGVGLKKLTTSSGESIEIKQECYASISKENLPAAHEWLRDNGHGDLIKITVNASYGRGEEATARELKEQLAEAGVAVEMKEGVHASTLKAFVKEQIEAGTPVPAALFSVHTPDVAKIKSPSPKKG